MASKNGLRIGITAGVVAALVSMLLPSPTTIATFKPWASTDRSVRWTFFGSLLVLAIIVLIWLGNSWE